MKNRLPRFGIPAIIGLLLVLCALWWMTPNRGISESSAETVAEQEPIAPTPVDPMELLQRQDTILGQGGTLAATTERLGLDDAQGASFLLAAKDQLDLRRLSPRTGFVVSRHPDGALHSIAVRGEEERYLRFAWDAVAANFHAETVELPLETRVDSQAGVVESSVGQALSHAAYSLPLTLAFADIFQWDVDLLVDPRPGDEVRVVYEVQTLGQTPLDVPSFGNAARQPGEFIGIGRIVAASYDGAIADADAYWVDEGASGNYYDAEGRPLRKSFLKSPLNYRRISSKFSRARRNPVTKKVSPHHGVDFAAAPGTPVTATADGRIISAGWDGPLGKAVRLRHGSEYVTIYGHLRGFAKGVRRGVDVKQGQVIGYVGSTGRSSGPHLHYTVVERGRPIDPLKMKNPSVEPLDEQWRPVLNAAVARWSPVLTGLATLPPTQIVDGATQPTTGSDAILSGS